MKRLNFDHFMYFSMILIIFMVLVLVYETMHEINITDWNKVVNTKLNE